VTEGDVQVYDEDYATDQSSVAVRVGERLDERQLLEGLLVHSANNFAWMLGGMVAGGAKAMVRDMNDAARSLGLTHTHYEDVSGFDPHSVSDAIDQLHLATQLMGDPTFTSIVRMKAVKLPYAGVVTTFTPFLGQGGVVGIKTGFTSQAGGCDVMAYADHVGGHRVIVIAVVLGQDSYLETPLDDAGLGDLHLVAAISHQLHRVVVIGAHRFVGTIGWAAHKVAVLSASTLDIPAYGDLPVHVSVLPGTWGADGVRRGQQVATLVVTSGALVERVPLVAARSLSR
jgi:D-alanyl-D-alanine carboxypeptidase (penicillin-binding protein 5/6)